MPHHLKIDGYHRNLNKKELFIPVKNEKESVQRFLFNGIGPPSNVPDVSPTPIAVEKIPQAKRRTSRSRSD